MAKNITVKLNYRGMGQLLKGPFIENELRQRMQRVQSALGSTAQLTVAQRPSRVVVKVARGSDFEEANTGELSRALDLAGGLRGTKTKTPKPKRGA